MNTEMNTTSLINESILESISEQSEKLKSASVAVDASFVELRKILNERSAKVKGEIQKLKDELSALAEQTDTLQAQYSEFIGSDQTEKIMGVMENLEANQDKSKIFQGLIAKLENTKVIPSEKEIAPVRSAIDNLGVESLAFDMAVLPYYRNIPEDIKLLEDLKNTIYICRETAEGQIEMHERNLKEILVGK